MIIDDLNLTQSIVVQMLNKQVSSYTHIHKQYTGTKMLNRYSTKTYIINRYVEAIDSNFESHWHGRLWQARKSGSVNDGAKHYGPKTFMYGQLKTSYYDNFGAVNNRVKDLGQTLFILPLSNISCIGLHSHWCQAANV